MVCPNCHSTDIITVQDEQFCISCGRVLPKTKSASSKSAAKAAAAEPVVIKAGADLDASPPSSAPAPAPAPPVATKPEPAPSPGNSDAAASGIVNHNAPMLPGKPAPSDTKADAAKAPDAKPADEKTADGSGPTPIKLTTTVARPAKQAQHLAEIVTKARAEAAEAKPPVPAVTVKPVAGSAAAAAAQAELNQAVARAMAPAPAPDPAPEAKPAPDAGPKPEDKANSEPAPGPSSSTEPAPAPVSRPKSVLNIVSRKRGPGRPKAGRLDVPAPSAPSASAAAATLPAAPPNAAASDAPSAVPASVSALAAPAKRVPPAAPRLHPSSPSRPMLDIKPPSAKTGPAAHSSANATPAEPPAPSPVVTVPDDTSLPAQPLILEDPPLGMGVLARASLHERVRPASLAWSLLPATFLALVAGGVVMALLRGHVDTAWAATQRAAWAVGGELVCIAALYYLSHSLVSGALMYGASRRAAHRPVPLSRQFGVSLNTWLPRLGLDLLVLVTLCAVGGLGAGLILTGGISWPVPDLVQMAGLFVSFLALVYLAAGILLTQGLGRAGLTVALVSPGQAFATGWRLFRRHFELTGFRVLALLLELVLLVPFAGAAALLIIYVPKDLAWLASIGVVVLATLAGGLAGAGTAAWWEAAYRHLVERDLPDQTAKYLTARVAERPRRFTMAVTIILVTTLVSAAIVWPWL